MPVEIAIDVLAAANMINLPRLVRIAEFALVPVRSHDMVVTMHNGFP